MNTTAGKSEFMLLFRNTQLEKRLTVDEMEVAMGRLNEWLGRWSDKGNLKGGQPLGDQGRVIAGSRQQRAVADGPFAEAKETVGGYVVVLASDLEEAAAIAEEWPLLDYDATVEVRPVMKQCATMERVGMQLLEVGA